MADIGAIVPPATRVEPTDVVVGNVAEHGGDTKDIPITALRRSNADYDVESINSDVRTLTNGIVRSSYLNNGDFIYNTSQFVLDYSTGRVGVGIFPATNTFEVQGTARIGGSAGAGSSQPLEIVGLDDGGLSITAPGAGPGNEVFIAGFMRDSLTAYKKVGAMAFLFTNTDVAGGNAFASWNVHTTFASAPGVTADDLNLAVWAKNGATFFPPGLTVASAPGDKIVWINNGMLLSAFGGPVATPHLDADQIVASNMQGNAGISILSRRTDKLGLYFGDEDDQSIGKFVYDNNVDSLSVTVNNSVTMLVNSSGNTSLSSAPPEGHLHLEKSAVIVTPNASADNLVIKENANAGITIITSPTGQASIFFGRAGIASAGQIYYNNSNNSMTLVTNAGIALEIDGARIIKMTSLAGTGSRPVVADANGVLSAP